MVQQCTASGSGVGGGKEAPQRIVVRGNKLSDPTRQTLGTGELVVIYNREISQSHTAGDSFHQDTPSSPGKTSERLN